MSIEHLREILLSSPAQRAELVAFMARQGIRLDADVEYACGFFSEEEELLACGGHAGCILKGFAVAPEAYWCAALAKTDDKEVKLETLDSDHLVSVEEMKRILESYAVPDSSVKIVPGYAAVSSYKYSLQDIADSISALFDHRYEIELPPKTAE